MNNEKFLTIVRKDRQARGEKFFTDCNETVPDAMRRESRTKKRERLASDPHAEVLTINSLKVDQYMLEN